MKAPGLLWIMALVLIFSCSKKEIGEINNLNGGRIDIFGHGGMGELNTFQPLPFNSWASLTEALDHTSTDGVEVDVQITLDSVLVAFHEQDLSNSTNCFGCVPVLNFSEVVDCEYYASFPGEVSRLVRIQDLFHRYASVASPPLLSLDSKTFLQCIEQPELQAYVDRMAFAYAQLIFRYGWHSNAWVETQSFELVDAIRTLDPNIKIYWLSNEMPQGIHRALELGCNGLVVSNDVINSDQVAMAHNNGLYVSIFNMYDRDSHVRAINKSPDHIQTDNIAMALDLLR